jgi:myo-inositol-1(or 4)-monophosphatase
LSLPKNPLEWIEILRRAAQAGKQSILENYDLNSRKQVVKKGVGGDLTLKIDEVSESAVHESLLQDLGEDSFVFVSEEIGEVKSNGLSAKPIVFCDPLDGSHNALVGVPLFSISLAVLGLSRKITPNDVRYLGDVDVGLIQSIPSKDEYYAIKGERAFHNDNEIRPDLQISEGSRFHTFGIECGDLDFIKKILKHLGTKQVYKLRILGSAAMSYCLLADGAFDGLLFVQPSGARTIDSPAGYLIAREAGRVFSDLSGKMKNLDRIKLGFDYKINIVGAKDQTNLDRLISLLNPRDMGKG